MADKTKNSDFAYTTRGLLFFLGVAVIIGFVIGACFISTQSNRITNLEENDNIIYRTYFKRETHHTYDEHIVPVTRVIEDIMNYLDLEYQHNYNPGNHKMIRKNITGEEKK